MAGQQFQYDDSGNTFFYFLTSFVGLIVIPATYYLWPRDQNAGESRQQLPADRLRPRRPLRAAPLRPSPARRVRDDAARAARPRVWASAAGEPGLGVVSPGASSGSSPPPFIVLLRSLLHTLFLHCSGHSLQPPPASLSSLLLVLLSFFFFFFNRRSRMGMGR